MIDMRFTSPSWSSPIMNYSLKCLRYNSKCIAAWTSSNHIYFVSSARKKQSRRNTLIPTFHAQVKRSLRSLVTWWSILNRQPIHFFHIVETTLRIAKSKWPILKFVVQLKLPPLSLSQSAAISTVSHLGYKVWQNILRDQVWFLNSSHVSVK